MSDFQSTLKVVTVFLMARGFNPAQTEDEVKDGHWLLRECINYSEHPPSICAQGVVLRQLFSHLESGQYLTGEPLAPGQSHMWTASDTRIALEAGGYSLERVLK